MEKVDISYFWKNMIYGQVRHFPVTPFSDAEFRILFDSIIGKPVPYTLKVDYKNPIPKTDRMSRVDFIDFIENGLYNIVLNNINKISIHLTFSFIESYASTGALVDKRFPKKLHLIHPFNDVLRGTYSGYYKCGGISSYSYFNGGVTANTYGNGNNRDGVLNKLIATHWGQTLNGEKPNVVRKQFLAAMKLVFNKDFEPCYINNNEPIQCKVVNVGLQPESIKRFLMKTLYNIRPE